MVVDFIDSHPWILLALITHLVVMGTVAYLILLERKVASWVQDRLGPNRVGPKGLLQPAADGLKFILKEDYRPGGVDKILFTLAPAIMVLVVIVSIAVLPLGGVRRVTRAIDVTGQDVLAAARAAVPSTGRMVGDVSIEHVAAVEEAGTVVTPARDVAHVTYDYPFQIANLNVGVLFILAVLSLAVYGVVLGGWASNNKYSFLGAMRATAQMISYEIPLGLSVLCVVVMYGTLDLGTIVEKQAFMWGGVIPAWNIFTQPLTFLMFLVCIHAEANRAPFDLAECEQELVGGYHTEYSAMRFALFFLGEYAGMITTSAVCVALFFGGWHFPGLTGPDAAHPAISTSLGLCLVRAAVYFVKVLVIVFVFMWTRWSLPRFRFDQLMMLAWRAMIPVSLALLLVTAVVVYYFGGPGQRGADMRVNGSMAVALLAANLALGLLTMLISVVIPAAPLTNRRITVEGSRFNPEPVAANN